MKRLVSKGWDQPLSLGAITCSPTCRDKLWVFLGGSEAVRLPGCAKPIYT